MIVFPNAKINLGLNILRRRSDGYHDISTVMVPVGWRDVLEIIPSSGPASTLTVTGRPVNCPPEKNLVMKAVNALRSIADFPEVDIYLEKIIPDGAGLGGGSADAAFTITALNHLFQLGLDTQKMSEIASTVGSDCPFFIYNRPMLATGRGEILRPVDVDLAGYDVVIIKPAGCSVSTAEAYAGISPILPDCDIIEVINSPVQLWQNKLINDFEKSVFAIHPKVGDIKSRLLELGADYAAMSGSGSSVFGIFQSDLTPSDLSVLFTGTDVHVSPLVK